jgi:23S rRNA (guanosine2251-2'-O)-methyltransferase
MDTQEIFGVRAIIECIEANQNIDKVFLLKNQKSSLFKQLENLIREKKVAHSYVPIERLDRFSNKNHQGAVATISPITYWDLEPLIENVLEKEAVPIFLLLDNITDTRNLGAIIRSASATGVAGIILPQSGSARINSDTIKTSAGALFSVPIAKVDHLKDAIYLFKAYEIEPLAISEKVSETVYEKNLKKPIALIMGSEEKGISKGILNVVTEKAKLPMEGAIASLNVAVACGCVLYEIVRQRKFS